MKALRGPALLCARAAAAVGLLAAVAAAAIAVALRVTPMQAVTVAGQVFRVGATAPDLSLHGPGELDLFGQSLPTAVQFAGPVRPRLQLADITINSELTTFVQGARHAAAPRLLGADLASGWKAYFGWETAIAGAGALILAGAVAGWRRMPRRSAVRLLAASLVLTEAVNLGAIMIAAYSAPAALRRVHSLNDLVGSAPPIPPVHARGPALPGVQAVIMGDSTAAGDGLQPVSGASRAARACDRSEDSYASDLQAANGWQVLNLACSGATIRHGLLGRQHRGGLSLPPQFGILERARRASLVIVSVGADDLNWSAMLRYCEIAPRCDDRATTAYFQQQLAGFTRDYLELLSRLAALPQHPRVIVNRYYDPFGSSPGCLAPLGLTPAKLRTLTSRLNALNTVLADGAAQFGFSSPQPDFTGHTLCSTQPYVQGVAAAAPFHPTALGELAIALADQAVLRGQSASVAEPKAKIIIRAANRPGG
jgi:hypothetical protein